jgi:hypothetical protein
MDLNECFNDLGKYNTHSNLSAGEKVSYMYYRQLDFVRTKYHISRGRPFIDPVKSFGKGETSRIKYKPHVLGTPNAQNTMTGSGQLFRGNNNSNPTTLSTNPNCVGWDWENGSGGTSGATAWGNSGGSAGECGTCTGNWYADVMYAVYPTSGNYQGNAEGVGLHDPDGNNADPITGCDHHVIVSTGTDHFGNIPMVYPGGGSYSVRLGSSSVNLGGNANHEYNPGGCTDIYGDVAGTETMPGYSPGHASAGEIIWQNITLTNQNCLLTYYYMVELNDGGHTADEMPYFNAWILDLSGSCSSCPIITCSEYTQQCTKGVPPPGYTNVGEAFSGTSPVYASGWQSNTIDFGPGGLNMIGKTVQVQFMNAGCTPGGHFGYSYIDGTCGPEALILPAPPICANTNKIITAPLMPPNTTYLWSSAPTNIIVGGNTGSTITVNGAVGTYTFSCTVTPPAPNNGCPFTVTGAMTYSASPNLTTSPTTTTNVTCFGLSTATATANPTGDASTPFTYAWAPSGGSAQTGTSLGVGTYTVTVTDAAGCSTTSTVAVTQPTALTSTATETNPSCFSGLGTATVTPVGGTGTYTYLWAPGGAVTQTVSLSTGIYTVTTTDAKGCTSTSSTIITVPQVVPLVWNGSQAQANNNWFNPLNWTPNCLPTCASDVNITNVGISHPDIGNVSGAAATKTITVSSGATLSFSNAASELDICGDFSNRGSLGTMNQGTIKFIGSTIQHYSNTFVGDFLNVVLDNTASLPMLDIQEGVGFQDLSVSITGTFTFTTGHGFIYTEGGRKLAIKNTTPGSLSGYASSSYINGQLNRFVTTGSYDFPVGGTPISGNTWPYELMNINLLTLGTPAITNLTVCFGNPSNYNSGAGGGLPLTDIESPCNNDTYPTNSTIDDGGSNSGTGFGTAGIWTVLSSSPNPVTPPTYNMTLVGTNFSSSGTTYGHTFIKRNPFSTCGGYTWAFSGIKVLATCTTPTLVGNTITTTRNGLSGFSQFSQVQDASPLPIELTSFDASCIHNNVEINWSTATETNNNFFTIKRSCDETFQYQEIAKINVSGNSSVLKNYSYTDKDATPSGECYYQLSQTDFDGVETIFPIISIDCKQNANFSLIGVVPNPASDQVHIFFNTNKPDIIHITIIDILGQQIFYTSINPVNGLNTTDLDVTSLSVGSYFVKVDNGQISFIKKIVKK